MRHFKMLFVLKCISRSLTFITTNLAHQRKAQKKALEMIYHYSWGCLIGGFFGWGTKRRTLNQRSWFLKGEFRTWDLINCSFYWISFIPTLINILELSSRLSAPNCNWSICSLHLPPEILKILFGTHHLDFPTMEVFDWLISLGTFCYRTPHLKLISQHLTNPHRAILEIYSWWYLIHHKNNVPF